MNLRTAMFSAAFAASLAFAAPALASDKTDILAVINQFKDLGNKLDHGSAAKLCAEQVVIVDMYPPYTWSGEGACLSWMKDGDDYGKAMGISDGLVAFEREPKVIITGDTAYAAMPTRFTYKVKGKVAAEPLRSVWAYTLKKLPTGWRITGMGWGLK